MWNIYEEPWLLAAVSLGLYLVIWTFRSVCPDRVKAWMWLGPVLVLGAGLAFDYGVKTDHEKVRITLKQLVLSAQRHDVRAIDQLVAPAYADSYHPSKARLLEHMRVRFSKPVFEKIKILSRHDISLENAVAEAGLTATVVFHRDSSLAQVVGRSLIARVEFRLSRQGNGQWLLSTMELKEVNRQPVNWRQASGQF